MGRIQVTKEQLERLVENFVSDNVVTTPVKKTISETKLKQIRAKKAELQKQLNEMEDMEEGLTGPDGVFRKMGQATGFGTGGRQDAIMKDILRNLGMSHDGSEWTKTKRGSWDKTGTTATGEELDAILKQAEDDGWGGVLRRKGGKVVYLKGDDRNTSGPNVTTSEE